MKPSSTPTSTPVSAHHSLSSLLPILDAFNHRNRNQHRTSHWWPVFRITRRAVRSLSSDLSRPHPRRPIPQSADWLDSHVVPRAYLAFSQLAADNQHAPLGLLLLALLARVHAVLTDLIPDRHATSTSTSTPTPTPTQQPSKSKSPPSQPLDNKALPTPDTGVAVSRDDLVLSAAKKTPSHTPVRTPPDPDTRKEKKKKKRKQDELSGLFGSLA